MIFRAKGNPNIKATHKTTLEFTKDDYVTERGDCILGIDADFNLDELKRLLGCKKLKITITLDDLSETILAIPNRSFSSDHEMVIRTTDFVSERTFAILADKASIDINRELVKKLTKPSQELVIEICESS